MADDFSVSVPIDLGSMGMGGGSSKETKTVDTKVQDLTKSITTGNVVADLVAELIGGLMKLLKPLLQVLNIFFMVIFLPLMPIIADLTKAVVSVIEGLMKLFGGDIDLEQFMKEYLGPALLQIVILLGKAILMIVVAIAKVLWETFKMFIEIIVAVSRLVGEKISEAFWWVIDKITQGAGWIWESIKTGFGFLLDIGIWIWDLLKTPFIWLGDIGIWIWDMLKKPFEWLGVGIKKLVNGVIKLINKVPGVNVPELANGGIVTGPTLALIGEAGPEAVIPLNKLGSMGGNTININNPSVRSENDIRKIAQEVSKQLQRDSRRRFS